MKPEASANAPIRMLLVEEDPYFRAIAHDCLRTQGQFDVAGVADSGQSAPSQARTLQPDVILMGLYLEGESTLSLVPLLKEHLPQAEVIVVASWEAVVSSLALFWSDTHRANYPAT